MNSLSAVFSVSEFITFSRECRKQNSFSRTFQASKRHIRHAMCVPYSIQYTSLHNPNLKLILTKHKNPKDLKLQLKSSILELRQEKKKKGSRNLLGRCMIDASKSKNAQREYKCKMCKFLRERMQRRGFCNLANVSVTVVTLT